jgi:hypothetical protein
LHVMLGVLPGVAVSPVVFFCSFVCWFFFYIRLARSKP